MKKIFFHILFLPFFMVVEIVNWLSILADEIFFPSYKKIIVSSPLYITGMPRTATTFLHNIINLDTERFTTMKLWEIAFAPSVCQKLFWIFIKKLDDKVNGPLAKIAKYFEDRILKGFDHFHPLSLFNIEEDEYLLIHNFSSGLLIFFLPILKLTHVSSSVEKKKLIQKPRLRFYHKCIKKHVYVFGKNKTYLAKSPTHILRHHSLKKVFPNLRMIYLLRTPHKSIPSTISLFQNFNTIFHSQLHGKDIVNKTLLLADTSFQYSMELNKQENSPTFIILKFEEFVKNPELVISNLYNFFHLDITNKFETNLRSYCLQQSTFISKHKYSLEEYGLNKNMITERYLDIYENFYGYEVSSYKPNLNITTYADQQK